MPFLIDSIREALFFLEKREHLRIYAYSGNRLLTTITENSPSKLLVSDIRIGFRSVQVRQRRFFQASEDTVSSLFLLAPPTIGLLVLEMKFLRGQRCVIDICVNDIGELRNVHHIWKDSNLILSIMDENVDPDRLDWSDDWSVPACLKIFFSGYKDISANHPILRNTRSLSYIRHCKWIFLEVGLINSWVINKNIHHKSEITNNISRSKNVLKQCARNFGFIKLIELFWGNASTI